MLVVCLLLVFACSSRSTGAQQTRVTIPSQGWQLIGDLVMPVSERPVPAVLLLNKAAGDRSVYRDLAADLAERGMASLRLDLPGHGESTNLGRFVPGEQPRSPMIWDAEEQIRSAIQFLRSHPGVDGSRIGGVGASYSGEELAEAGRRFGYVQAYVMLSPGSFSAVSIQEIDASGVPWLYIASRDERYLREITDAVKAQSQRAHLELLPGTSHATDLLVTHPDLAPRVAVWLEYRLASRE